MQEIRLANLTAVLFRCDRCASSEVPPDLPPLLEHVAITPEPFVRAGKVKLPFDFKLAAAGVSREPGEDG